MSNTHAVYGKYLLLDRIAVGGMAEVYKAKSFGVHGFERLLVIKKILPHLSQDQEFVQMFIDEAKIAVELSHANICQISDLGRINNNYFIAMEFINGKDLRAILKKSFESNRPIPAPFIIYIVLETLKGLDYAHSRMDNKGQALSLVHRDISPQNIMISYFGEVKIVDFGIAKTESKLHRTQVGVLKGKFGYMSPEQAGGLELDARTDLFSTAIILYECLTQRRLFHADTDFQTIELIRECRIPPPQKYNPEISSELENFLYKALAKEPQDRFQNAHEMQIALSKIFYTQYSDFSSKDLGQYMNEIFKKEIIEEQEALKRAMDAVPNDKIQMLSNAAEPSYRPTASSASNTIPSIKKAQASSHTDSAVVVNFNEPIKAKGSFLGGLFKLIFFIGLPAYASFFAYQKWWPHDTLEATSKKEKKAKSLPKGLVEFTSDPSGATLLINGEAKGVTPVSIQLSADQTLDLSYELEGYETFQKQEYISPGQKQANLAHLEKIKLATSIQIESVPSGAEIFLNGQSSGKKTPATLTNLDPKETYNIALKKMGFQETSFDRSLAKDANAIKAILKKESATLVLQVTPQNAVIKLNGTTMGDKIENLSMGKPYKITVQASGYISFSKTVTPSKAEEELEINLKRVPLVTGTVNINAKPWASVVLDGQPLKDNTPLLNFDVSVGRHEFVFQHPDFESIRKTVDIKEGTNPSIIIDFKKAK